MANYGTCKWILLFVYNFVFRLKIVKQDSSLHKLNAVQVQLKVERMLKMGRVEECVDPRLNKYPLEVFDQMVRLGAECVRDEPKMRPPMAIVVMRLEQILTPPTPTSFTSMFKKKVPLWMVFFGADSIPWYDSDIIAGYEREVEEAVKESSEERINECLLKLSQARVHSKRPKDVKRGIEMLKGSLACTNDISTWVKMRYLLAVGHYRRGEYLRSRQLADQCLKFETDMMEAINLKKAIEDRMKKDGVIGICIGTTVFGAVVILTAALVSRKK